MTEITTHEVLIKFLRDADNFHDALIRECALVALGFVDTECRMHGDTEPFEASVFLQTQASDVPGIQIEFDGVTRFTIDRAFDLRPSGSIRAGEVRFSFTATAGEKPQVIARGMRYRFLDKTCLGQRQLLTSPRR
ncbi:MAG: hypothetical protein ACOYIG_05850 [Acetivibrionales bacterium]|jgi:hypothetical protein